MTTKISAKLQFVVLATDIILFKIFDNDLKILLGKVQSNPHYPNHWAAIGGLVRPEETAEQAAGRLMKEKAGIENIYKEQLYTFSEINRDPRNRVVSVAHLAIARQGMEDSGQTAAPTKWVDVKRIPKLAYDHNAMAVMALDRLRARLGYTNIAQYFLPDLFTLSDLQNVYEIVLGKQMDKRNFRKKMIASGMLKDLKQTRKQGVMRPAGLYAFASGEIAVMSGV